MRLKYKGNEENELESSSLTYESKHARTFSVFDFQGNDCEYEQSIHLNN